MTSSEPADRALAETAAGAVQGGGEQDATKGPRPDTPPSRRDESTTGVDDFVVDHDADPPQETQPTTS